MLTTRSTLLPLLCAVVSNAATLAVAAEVPPTLRTANGLGYQATVAEVGATSCAVSGLRFFDAYAEEDGLEPEDLAEDLDFVEGHYLLHVAKTEAELVGGGPSWLVRGKVEEITTKTTARVTIGPAAAKVLGKGWVVRFNRPFDVTTATMRGLPDLVPVVDRREQVPGLGVEASKAYLVQRSRVKRIGIALHNYHDSQGQMPPGVVNGKDGKPWHSWRVLLLPYLGEEYQPLYSAYRFDEPWDGPNNRKLIDRVPDVYRDPIHGNPKDGYTHVATVFSTSNDIEAWTAFDRGNLVRPPRTRGGLPQMTGGRKFSRVTDGLANTFGVGPVGPERKIPWTKPEDVDLGEVGKGLGTKLGFAAPYKSRENGRGGLFLKLDGAVVAVSNDVDGGELKRWCTIADARPVDELPLLVDSEIEAYDMTNLITFEEEKGQLKAVLTYDPKSLQNDF